VVGKGIRNENIFCTPTANGRKDLLKYTNKLYW